MASGKSLCTVILTLALPCRAVLGQTPGTAENLFSPLVADTFRKMASQASPASPDAAKVAHLLLSAAARLDPRADCLYADMLTLGAEEGDPKAFESMIGVFAKYADKRADFTVLQKAVRYFLSTADSRKAREDLLLRLFDIVRESNPTLASEILAEYAGLIAETARVDDAAKYYEQAWYYNRYNQRAFARLDELLQKQGRGLSPGDYATSLRLAMDVNPMDVGRVLAFAEYAERLALYDVAAQAYEYAADLFAYANPQDPLPASIYLPWMLTCYNTPALRTRCLDIAGKVRQGDRFDLYAEGLAGAAAVSVGNAELGRRTLDEAGRRAARTLGSAAAAEGVTALQLAWFYAFADPSAEQALAWANRAFTSEPNQPDARAMFAYVLATSGQVDVAATFVEEPGDNQIAVLSRAVVQLAQKDQAAIATLKQAVALDPASLAAAKARDLLQANGSEYLPAVSPEVLRAQLNRAFGDRVVPPFRLPKDIFSAKLNLPGSEFSYGSEMVATLVIANESDRPLIIADDGILTGRIRVDADIRGDIRRHIDNLIDTKAVPSHPVAPGEYHAVTLDLMTGRLGELLMSFPQASVEIEFVVNLDPAPRPSDRTSGVPGPVRATVKRQGVVLNRDYLMQRLDTLSRGQEGQKIRAAELFAGLLMEQDYMALATPIYRYMRVDRPLLVDAVKRCLADESWKVRVETMKALMPSAKLDYELTRVMSSNLNDQRWPVRVMAMLLLDKLQVGDFNQVLTWAARYDSDTFVRQIALLLAEKHQKVPDRS